MKKDECKHEFMFNILLGTECWHIVPHPTKKEEKMISLCLKEIIKELEKDEVSKV